MITKLIPKDPKITLDKAFEGEGRLRELEQDPRFSELFKLARKLEGLNRHSSIHAAGVVIGKSSLDDYVPLYRDPKTGGVAPQYAMNYLENCGLVKMDFLGLKTLDLIKNTVDIIRGRGGEYAGFDINTVDEHDPATYAMLAEERNEGVFQFEKSWWKDILRRAKPASIDELTALTSLGRPGPMQFIPQFIESKWNPRFIKYPDPSLEDILRETYGVIVYQEQVMQVARIIAGYSMGQADLLRRAMGKKKKEIIDAEKGPFLEGALKQGYSREKAGEIYDILVPFAGYGFNKSHAAAYSVLSFRTAYLKANFPAEFMAANLSNEIGSADKEKLPEYIEVTRRLGIAVDPPDVNRSDRLFTVVDGCIVYGLKAIKGVGDGPAEEILRCRREGGSYRSFVDFLDRVNMKATGKADGKADADGERRETVVGKKVVELLIQTGAFDCFDVDRATLLGNLEAAAEYAQKKKEDKMFGQSSLFEDTKEQEYPEFEFQPFPPMDRMEKLNIEKQLIGFYISGHPLDDYKEAWERYVKLDLADSEKAGVGEYTLIGILKTLKPHTNKSGKTMAFASLQDYRGEIDMVFFEKTWEDCRDIVAEGNRIAVKGRLDLRRGTPSLVVSAVLEQERLNRKNDLESFCSTAGPLEELREAWKQFVTLDLSNLKNAKEDEYTLIGTVAGLRPFNDKNGREMAFGTLADYRGEIDLVFFEKTWESCKNRITVGAVAALKGRLDLKRDKPCFRVGSILDTDRLKKKAAKTAAQPDPAGSPAGEGQAAPASAFKAVPGTAVPGAAAVSETAVREVHIRLVPEAAKREEALYPLRDYLLDNPGSCFVYLHVPVEGGEMVIRAGSPLAADSARLDGLKSCGAVDTVWAA
jgi:DNA polymerase-3 subunit alpha